MGDTHTHSLVSGAADNSNFRITGGNTLVTFAIFDFETQSSYTIRVRSQDSAGNTFEKDIVITIVDVLIEL